MSARRPRWIVNLATVIGLAITMTACYWQYQKGHRKDMLAAESEAALGMAPVQVGKEHSGPDALRWRRVFAEGKFLPHTVILLDNQPHGAQPGYVVFTALRLDGGRHLLVKRGWIPGSLDRSQLPQVTTPADRVKIEGIAYPPSSRFVEYGDAGLNQRVWQNVNVERFAARFGLDFEPLILQQEGDMGDGLLREWPKPATGSAKNFGYALQWGAMALSIVIFYGLSVYRNRKQQGTQAGSP